MRMFAQWGAMAALCTMATVVCAQVSTEQIIPAKDRAFDFGAVARAATTEHRFQIHNPFDTPMHLRSISASCGCTTPIIETEWIQPGQSGSVLARFNTGTFSGDRKASLNLTIDKPNFMQLQLNVKGYIRSDIVINPGELNFGAVAQGETKEIEARIEYAGRGDWQITSVTSQIDSISTTFEEIARSPGRVSYLVKAKLAAGDLPGPIADVLTLHTNDLRLKSVPLNCIGQIQAPLTATPASLALGEVQAGVPLQQRLLLKATRPFKILDMQAADMEARFEPASDAKAIQFANVTLLPKGRTTGQVTTQLIIQTDLAGAEQIAIEVTYTVAPSAQSLVKFEAGA